MIFPRKDPDSIGTPVLHLLKIQPVFLARMIGTGKVRVRMHVQHQLKFWSAIASFWRTTGTSEQRHVEMTRSILLPVIDHEDEGVGLECGLDKEIVQAPLVLTHAGQLECPGLVSPDPQSYQALNPH